MAGNFISLTPRFISHVYDAVCNGVFPATAAALRGVSKTQFNRWYEKGREINQRLENLQPGYEMHLGEFETNCVALFLHVEEASAVAEAAIVEKIFGSSDWRAAAWLAEKINPAKMGKREVIQIGNDDNNRELDLTKLTPEQLEAAIAILEHAQTKPDPLQLEAGPTVDVQEV